MLRHPLIQSLLTLKGNPRACVYTEPLFVIPYFLYIPYASIYMLALGLSDQQVGLITSIGMGCQVFTALIGGAITDKFGRRMTTFVSDLVSWSIPALILVLAQNIWYFLAAAILNSFWRISSISWTCLMVEDAKPEQIIPIWTWVYIAGLIAAFFAPLSGKLVEITGLATAARWLYFFALVTMTIKFIVLFVYSTETQRGRERLLETRSQSLFKLFSEYHGVAGQILRAPQTLLTMGLLIVIGIGASINGTFWGILVTQKLKIPPEHIALFPLARSLVMLAMFFLITPRLSSKPFHRPMIAGFAGIILSQLLLIAMPAQNYFLLVISAILEASSIALVNPLVDSLLVFTVDPGERARINAILYVFIFLFTSPFGWIAGTLSGYNRTLPFVLNLALYAIGMALAWQVGRTKAWKGA